MVPASSIIRCVLDKRIATVEFTLSSAWPVKIIQISISTQFELNSRERENQ